MGASMTEDVYLFLLKPVLEHIDCIVFLACTYLHYYYKIPFQLASKDFANVNLSMINQYALSTGCSGMSEMQGKVKRRPTRVQCMEDFHFRFHFHFHILCLTGGKRLKVVGLVVRGGGGLSVTGLGSWIIRHLSRTWCDF
jgi:hypothetical protein